MTVATLSSITSQPKSQFEAGIVMVLNCDKKQNILYLPKNEIQFSV